MVKFKSKVLRGSRLQLPRDEFKVGTKVKAEVEAEDEESEG